MDFGTKRVLVTGSTGWLGRRLVDTLVNGLPGSDGLAAPQPGLEVRCLVAPGEDGPAVQRLSDRVALVIGDLRQPAHSAALVECAKGGVLFHAAGVIHPRRVNELYQVNVEGTRHLLEAAERAGVRRAVIVSSNSPCGCNPTREHRFDERSPYHPYMNYGRSKMLMELAVREVQERRILETVVIRAPWFYGPWQPPRQTQFFRMIRDGRAPIVGDGGNPRSMAYIDNLCQGLLRAALEPRANGQIYWIADEDAYTMNQTIACVIGKAQAELGYRPAIALEEGMRRSLRWCFENGYL